MIRTLLPLFIVLGTAPSLLSASRTPSHLAAEKEKTYTIRSGDSLSTIAHRYHVTIQALRQANDLGEQSMIHPGQKLRIPSAKTNNSTKTSLGKSSKKPTQKLAKKGAKTVSKKTASKKSSTKKASRTYKVQAGDTLSGIAHEHGISTRELLQANGLKADAMIRVGQTLTLPGKAQKTEKGNKKIAKAHTGENKATKTSKKSDRSAKGAPDLYEVQSGDTLFSIARKYHTPLKDLMSLNKIAPTDVIRPGQKLKIPGVTYRAAASKTKAEKVAKKKSPKASKPVVYTVKHGDSLWAIAHKNNVSITTIRKLNKLKPGQPLRSGMKLVLKAGKKPETTTPAEKKKKAQIYTVKKGDTLWGIARQHKTTVAKLRELNKMDKKAVIHRGMKLTVGYTEVSQTRLAKKSKKSASKVASRKSGKKKTRVAARTRKSKTRQSKADRRIHNALAALNAKGSSRGSHGGDYNVIKIAKRYLGRRYVWGAEGPSSFDCSGFTQYVMRKSKGVRIPRVSRKQAYYGKYVSRRNLKPGDLIFFDTSRRRRGYVNHVGIYIGNNKFIHASSARHRVVITSLNRPFYRARFKWGRRIN